MRNSLSKFTVVVHCESVASPSCGYANVSNVSNIHKYTRIMSSISVGQCHRVRCRREADALVGRVIHGVESLEEGIPVTKSNPEPLFMAQLQNNQ